MQQMMHKELIDVSHVSKRGSSLRITVPRKVTNVLALSAEEIIGFYLEDGKVVIEKLE